MGFLPFTLIWAQGGVPWRGGARAAAVREQPLPGLRLPAARAGCLLDLRLSRCRISVACVAVELFVPLDTAFPEAAWSEEVRVVGWNHIATETPHPGKLVDFHLGYRCPVRHDWHLSFIELPFILRWGWGASAYR